MPDARPRPRRSTIRFPDDEGPHPDFLTEWWYGHFSLTATDGSEYGVVAAYFDAGVRVLAISDLQEEKLHHEVSSSSLRPAEGCLDMHWGVYDHWRRTDADSFSYRIESYGAGIVIDLDLRSLKPPLPGCGTGVIRWTGGTAHYYQLTRLEAKGRIELHGRKLEVRGLGVMDHQWMSYVGEEGWDWFSVQLDNGAEVVFWRLVKPDWSVRSRDLTIMSADGSVYHRRRFTLRRLETWVSPWSGQEYGTAWRVREKGRDLDLEIRARYPQQEIRMFEDLSLPTFPFWEGNMSVSGRMDGEAVSGIGFTEQMRPHAVEGGLPTG
jgi:predicted secreted hydrolase